MVINQVFHYSFLPFFTSSLNLLFSNFPIHSLTPTRPLSYPLFFSPTLPILYSRNLYSPLINFVDRWHRFNMGSIESPLSFHLFGNVWLEDPRKFLKDEQVRSLQQLMPKIMTMESKWQNGMCRSIYCSCWTLILSHDTKVPRLTGI